MNRSSDPQSQRVDNDAHTAHSTITELEHISLKLLEIADSESHTLKNGNIQQFSKLQKDKAPLAQNYMQLAKDFRDDPSIADSTHKDSLVRLERLQTALQKKAQENNSLIDNVAKKEVATTGSTLFAAQEIAQQQEIR